MNKVNEIEFSLDNYIDEHAKVLNIINKDDLDKSINMVKSAFAEGKKVATCGNGGSASTASHFITDWNKMINLATGKKFRGLSFADNIGLITAYGNDLSYDEVFSGQCKAILDEGDLLIAISGSGNSKNIIECIKTANDMGVKTLAILGYDGGDAIKYATHSFLVPSFDMQVCEDIHLIFGHMVMKTLCNSKIVTVGI